MIRFFTFILLGLFIFSQHSIAEDKASKPAKAIPVETMQQIDDLNKLMEKAKELELLANSISRQKYSDCLKAFGNQKFCQCLKDKSPVGIDFAGYIKVVTTTKEDLGYSQADKETKGLIDNTLNARESCVSGSN
jgi:hypothetical protein